MKSVSWLKSLKKCQIDKKSPQEGKRNWPAGKDKQQVVFAIQRFACIRAQKSAPVKMVRAADNRCKAKKL
ncbi:hypothetical protein AXA91_27425 [Salmonella enterica]|nr:hypothetical protein [Salmonella enterica]EGW6282904.1 hypothetical protein [Salmonella enterica]